MPTREASGIRRLRDPLARSVGWIAAGATGWTVFRLLGGPEAPDGAEIGLWLLGAGLVLVIGLPLRLLTGAGGDPAQRWAEFAAVAFGFAISAGWTIGVNLGGPLTGLAIGTALVACPAGLTVGRVLPGAVVVAVAMVLGRLLHGERLTVLGLGTTLGAGLVALVGVLLVAGRREWVRSTALTVTAWGVAWVGAWFVTTRLVDRYSVPLSLAGEIVGAMGIGGWVIAVMARDRTRERTWRVAGRWTAFAAVAYVAAWGIAALVWAIGLLPGDPLSHMDVGTVVALPFAVWFAALPTLAALAPTEPGRPRRVSSR